MALNILCLAQGSTILSITTNFFTAKRFLGVDSSIPLQYRQLDPLLDTRGLESQYIKGFFLEVK